VLIGFVALAWGVPAGLSVLRQRITVSDDGIVIQAPFSARVLCDCISRQLGCDPFLRCGYGKLVRVFVVS
jgi:hypothetical protein